MANGSVFIRFLNAAPLSGDVDIYMNGQLKAGRISYKDFTEYFKVESGVYEINIYPAGTRIDPVAVATVNLINGVIYTAAIVGTKNEETVELINDRPRYSGVAMAYVRFINLSPNSPPLSLYIDDVELATDVLYKEVEGYFALKPYEHTIKIRQTGQDKVLLSQSNMVLRGGDYYAIYLVGFIGAEPSLEVLVPLEGAGYLTFDS